MPRREPDKHFLSPSAGVVTNANPRVVAGVALRSAINMDSFGKFQTIGKVPGSTRKSPQHGDPVYSLHQFEYSALNGRRTYEQLTLAGGEIRRLDDADTATVVARPPGATLFDAPLSGTRVFDRMHFCGVEQRGLVTGGLKYDGANLSNWGVRAPGTTPTYHQTMDDPTNWAISADALVTLDTETTKDGNGGLKVEKSGTSTAEAHIFRGGLGLDISDVAVDLAYVWCYLPAGTLQKLATSGAAVEVSLGDAGLVNADHHSFAIGELLPGWNLLVLGLTSPDSSDGSGANLASVDTVRLRTNYLNAATTHEGVTWDGFYTNAPGAPTATVNLVSGNLSGAFTYRVTFLTEYGIESNGGPASDTITPAPVQATGEFTLTAQPAHGDEVTIGSFTYTFQTTLTDVDGNVEIGASAADTLENLQNAIEIEGTPGTGYAASTTLNSQVTATRDGLVLTVTAIAVGTLGNSVITTTDSANGSWAAATCEGGIDSVRAGLANIPISSDPQVIARRIYRDLDGDSIYRFVAQIDDNVTTTYADNIAEAALGQATMPVAGDAELDSSPPPRMTAATAHENRVFGIDADNPTILHVSDVNQPEIFRLVDELQFDEPLVAVESHGLGLLLYGLDRMFLLTGDGVSRPFRAEEASPVHGANNFRSVTKVKAIHFGLREAESFIVTNPADPWLINSPIFDQWKEGGFNEAFLLYDRSRFRVLYVGKSSGSSTFDTVWCFQFGTSGMQQISGEGAGVDPQDVRAGFWYQLDPPSEILDIEAVENDDEVAQLWAACADGYVYHLNDPDTRDWASGVTTTPVVAEAEWHAVGLGLEGSQTGRGEPRFLVLSATATVQSTWTATITLLDDIDGKVVDTIVTTFTLEPGKNSPIIPIDTEDETKAEFARVKLSNGNAGEDGRFDRIDLMYLPSTGFRGERD